MKGFRIDLFLNTKICFVLLKIRYKEYLALWLMKYFLFLHSEIYKK